MGAASPPASYNRRPGLRRRDEPPACRLPRGLDVTTDKIRYTLHMKLEWGDWYVAEVSEKTLG